MPLRLCATGRLLLPLLPLLLLLLPLLQLATAAPTGKHDCPPKSENRSDCSPEGTQSVMVKRYEWNEAVGRCQSKIQLKEVACGDAIAKGSSCPEPRVVEPGKCNDATKQEKTLVEHYEPDGSGGCKLRKDFTYPACRKRPPKDNGCPEPRFYQKPCSGTQRQVFKFYYETAAGKDCSMRTAVSVEPCGALVRTQRCPPSRVTERGQCRDGYRTVIREQFARDPSGKCAGRSHYVTQLCAADAADADKCPPPKVTKGPCKDGLRGTTKLYYARDERKGRCVRKFSIGSEPCGAGATRCPSPRVLEPGPCSGGHARVLVTHFEPEPKTGRCQEAKSYVTHSCDDEAKNGTSAADDKCPDARFSQGPCEAGYRNVFAFSFSFSEALGRCLRHVQLQREHCAALVTATACPADDSMENGACGSDGFRVDILYRHQRNAKGRCVQVKQRVSRPCEAAKAKACPPKKVHKVGNCEHRLQQWLTVYYEYSQAKRKCVRKFSSTEKSCGAAEGVTAKTKCPTPRVVEPGPCVDGKQQQLVEHYEFDDKNGTCKIFKDYVEKSCGHEGDEKEKSKEAKKVEHGCDESKISQGGCSGGYRTVTTEYFVYDEGKARCVKKIRQKTEKCAKLVKASGCPSDAVVEEGPCTGGFRTNIVFKYSRDDKGSCRSQKLKTTVACATAVVACPPRNRQKVGDCKEGIQRWLTTYYAHDKEKDRCVRKLSFKELSCSSAKHSCPTPRAVEPGPCTDGSEKVLIEHYEYNDKEGKCVALKNFVTRPCGKAKAASKEEELHKRKSGSCPDPVYHQQACRRSFRTVLKVYSEWSDAKGRCVRRIKMEEEPCAALLKTGCPADETVEAGPCKDGFRHNIVYGHRRDKAGQCQKVELRKTESCSKKDDAKRCKPRSRRQLKPCSKEGFERWLTVYFVWSSVKKRCVRKLRIKELSCKTKACPTPRTMEPGPCKDGQQKILIEHYELDKKTGKCQPMKDFVHKACGIMSKRKLASVKHSCPESVYNQQPCQPDGYRSVVKFYYRYSEDRGRCVKNMKIDSEKCSKLAAVRTNCQADEVLENGPCTSGFRQNIIFKYARAEDDSCTRVEHRVTERCSDEKAAD